MRWLRRGLVLAVFVGLLVGGWRFAARNADPVSVDYLAGSFEGVALWAALLGAFSAGAFLVGVIGLFQLARLGMLTRRYRKTALGLEAEIHELRNLPLAGAEPPGDPAGEEPLGVPGGSPLERGA